MCGLSGVLVLMNRQAGQQNKEVALHKARDAGSKVQVTERRKKQIHEKLGKFSSSAFFTKNFITPRGKFSPFRARPFQKGIPQANAMSRVRIHRNVHNSTGKGKL